MHNKLLLMGCSWGVPNYKGPPGVPAEHHSEYLLKKLGYDVVNASLNGRSNLDSLDVARSLLSDWKPDYVIWFHTEAYREKEWHDFGNRYSIVQQEEKTYRLIYDSYRQFVKELYNTSWIIIGGQAAVHPVYFEDPWHKLLIPCWRSKIANRLLPPCRISIGDTEFRQLIKNSNDTAKDKMILLEQYDEMTSWLTNNEDFPDGCHPGTLPHKMLVEELTLIFNDLAG